MKKKITSALIALLAVSALTACGQKTKEDTGSSSATASSKVEESTSSSSVATKTLKESTVSYLSDQEIEAIQTIGDVKAVFRSLLDSYVADFDELVAQLPEEGKKGLAPFREQLVQMLEKQQEALETQFASYGDDSTSLPDEGREQMVTAMKTMRDQLKAAMVTARDQAKAFLQ